MSALNNFRLLRGMRWFSSPVLHNENGWYGPHVRLEDAIVECASNREDPDEPIFVARGSKLTKAEIDEYACDYEWEVETKNALEIKLPRGN